MNRSWEPRDWNPSGKVDAGEQDFEPKQVRSIPQSSSYQPPQPVVVDAGSGNRITKNGYGYLAAACFALFLIILFVQYRPAPSLASKPAPTPTPASDPYTVKLHAYAPGYVMAPGVSKLDIPRSQFKPGEIFRAYLAPGTWENHGSVPNQINPDLPADLIIVANNLICRKGEKCVATTLSPFITAHLERPPGDERAYTVVIDYEVYHPNDKDVPY